MRACTILVSLAMLSAVAGAQDWYRGEPGCARARQAARRWAVPDPRDPGFSGLRDERAADTDVLHYDLDIEIDPNAAWLGGTSTMTVRSTVDSLTVFRFRLQDWFTISAMSVGGVSVNWTRVDTTTVDVTLDRVYQTDEVFELHVAYGGYPVSGADGITFRQRSGAAEVYTNCEPWFTCRWRPAKDDLEDKTTADFWVTVPQPMVVASNGLLLATEDVGQNRSRYHWKTEYPTADYLYCVCATNYGQFETTWDYAGISMPLQFFIYPEDDTAANRAAWLATTDVLTTYSDLFGLYPFVAEKYGMCEWGWGGGMEHQTLTSIIGYFWWTDGIVHELSHQWWGDDVTCATWHDIWLNEGFADYAEALWYEHAPGSSGEPALHSAMSGMRPQHVSESVYCYDISNVDRIFDYDTTYLKGGWVLHMLRHVVGEPVFFEILSAYRAAFTGRAATTADFQAVAETVWGRDLGWFLDEWVYAPGAPAYRYGWHTVVADGRDYVEVYIRQLQAAPYPIFTMPIDVVTTGGGAPVTNVVWNTAVTQHFVIPVSGPVSTLQFDPKPWILSTGRSSVAFVEGPPKLVHMSPAPGAVVAQGSNGVLELGFQKDVAANASHFTLSGARHGATPFTYLYDTARRVAILTPGTALPSDTYTLTVSDSIIDGLSGQHLDGELTHPFSSDPLPSGDGVPGGAAVAHFTVFSYGDLNCDGVVNFGDINPFVSLLSSGG